MKINNCNIHTTCLIVAHPDDETLWAGGTILMHPEWEWKIYTLCRASDTDRFTKFHRALTKLGATGCMADMDDGVEQKPLSEVEIEQTVLKFIGAHSFDLLLTHGPEGEYTRHRRHEEASKAVLSLWTEGKIRAGALWFSAYTDGEGNFLPRAEKDAHLTNRLSDSVWKEKYRIITEIYGFAPESWEARTTPKVEAFWCFDSPPELMKWLKQKRITL